jgi:predicted DNA-binding transcriptional regulator YafY
LNRIDRLHAILTHLQSKKRVTAQEIADRFEISLRTVYRDVKALDESGVPVIGEAGTGYSIMEGYRLPPVMFTQEEAAALLLGAKLAERWTDASVKRSFDTALYKIKAVLRSTDKDHMDTLSDHVEVLRPRLPMQDDPTSSQHIVGLQKAIVEKKVIFIHYCANNKGLTTERFVEPIGLCYYSLSWHMIGWCRLRNDYRDFRVDRIQRLQIKDEGFETKSHQSLQEYIKTMMQTTDVHEVVVRFERDVVPYLHSQKYYYGYVREEEDGDYIRMFFLTSYFENFARWLLMAGKYAIVVSPESLVAIMKNFAEELYSHYK